MLVISKPFARKLTRVSLKQKSILLGARNEGVVNSIVMSFGVSMTVLVYSNSLHNMPPTSPILLFASHLSKVDAQDQITAAGSGWRKMLRHCSNAT